MDEKAKFALKRDIVKGCLPGPRELTRSERIWAAWRFTQGRGISVEEMMANLPPETVHALAAAAKEVLDGVPDEWTDRGMCIGTIWPALAADDAFPKGPDFPWDSSNPYFVPFSFVRELTGGTT